MYIPINLMVRINSFFTFPFRIPLLVRVMNLLEILEHHLGNIELWPSPFLTYLFHDHPSPVQPGKLKKVIAFFYGNEVPQQMAYQFYNACNGRASRFVLEQFHAWYHTWHKLRCRPHLAVYWNMRLRTFLYINGLMMNQSDLCCPRYRSHCLE
jgi:hypothetical protein